MSLLYTNGNARYSIGSSVSVGAMTYMAWVYLRSAATTSRYLLNLNYAANSVIGTIVNMTSGVPNIWAYAGAGSMRPCGTTLSAGRWYHLCVTWDGVSKSGVNWYVDGALSNGATGSDPGASHNYDNYSIGGRSHAYAAEDRVLVDDLIHKVRVYKRVLTAQEISDYYANPTNDTLLTTYASDLLIRADYDASSDTNHGAKTTSTGTAVLTSRPPLDLSGVAWFNDTDNTGSADSAGIANTITSSRFATMANFAATGANAAETSTSGPKQNRNVNLKIGVAHASHSSGAAAYVSAATGSGPTWDNRNITVFGWIAPVAARRAPAETILHLGDPATAGSAVLELSQTYSKLQISRAGGATEVGTSDIPMQTTLPRFFAVRCTASERTLMVDSIRKNLGSAFTSATSTGLRIGAPLGGTSNPFVGDLYKLCIAQRALSDAELDALLTYGKDVYHHTTPTWGLMAEGSSTMWGTSDSTALNEGILSQIKQEHPEAYIVNHANASENVDHFDNGYAAGVGASVSALKTAYGWGDNDFLGILQVYGNDFDSTGTITLLDRYSAGGFNYVSVYNKWVADIGTIYIMWPVVRTDYASDGLDEGREEDVRSFMSLTGSGYPQFRYIVRPSAIEATSASAAHLQAITANVAYYIGDETHLTPLSMRLYGPRLLQITSLFVDGPATGGTRSSSRINRIARISRIG